MTPLRTHVTWLGGWLVRHRRWIVLWLVLAAVAGILDRPSTGAWVVLLGLTPAVACTVVHGLAPVGYERWCAGPARRFGWRRHVRRRWAGIAESCGLAHTVPSTRRRLDGARDLEHHTITPRLRRVRTRGHLLELTIRARAGQTVEDLDHAAPRIASTLAAVGFRTRPVSGAGSGSSTIIELVMADALTTPADAAEPDPVAVCEDVRVGRRQGGGGWWLQLRGRHTLVAGCSGAGKGSVLWGICCGLSPAVRANVAQLWGIDLKRGVELAMGSGLFSAHAYTPTDALAVLKALMAVIDERGRAMAGTTRLHQPVVGDPLHVLVIDELAALTAYADVSIRREAERLLSEILTQGRALGVVVVGCVQDPRKDVVAMRGLFTQTIALRLRSSEETVMVLGEGMTKVAPAHRISPTHPGTAWVVGDDGSADRVRADFWPDPLIRGLAARYATDTRIDLTIHEASDRSAAADPGGDARESCARPRSPRQRSPRTSTRTRVPTVDGKGAA